MDFIDIKEGSELIVRVQGWRERMVAVQAKEVRRCYAESEERIAVLEHLPSVGWFSRYVLTKPPKPPVGVSSKACPQNNFKSEIASPKSFAPNSG